jgi:NADPH2:quinone reductase
MPHTAVSLLDAVRRAHPDGIDALIDLVSDAEGFAALASLVRQGGTAITPKYVADPETLAAAGVTGINFVMHDSSELLARVADALVAGRIVPAAGHPYRAGGSACCLEPGADWPR